MAIATAFDVARRALVAHETALGVVANNVANANTPGYTRQVADLVADRATLSTEGQLIGRGVHIQQIRQVLDPLVEKRLVRAQAEQSGMAARRDELVRLSALLSDLDEPSLTTMVGKFFDSTDALARNPDGLAERETMLGTARAMAIEFNRRGAGLGLLQRTVDDRFVEYAHETNDALERIASLNTLIVTRESTGVRANDLRDERSEALKTLSAKLGVYAVESDAGNLRVAARDGVVLVDGGDVLHSITVEQGDVGLDGSYLHQLGFTGPGGVVLTRSTAFAEGQLGQLAVVRDIDIPTAADNLDTVAGSIRDRVNAVHVLGTDLDGNSAALRPLFGGTNAENFSVLITNHRHIAAALGTQPGDNRNALAIADLRTTPFSELNGASFNTFMAVEQGRLGQAAQLADDQATASELVTQQLERERSALSGVNLNEEMVLLLRTQRAFQASAQVINVANVTLDELLNMV